jgi:hypothetical protein
MGLAFPFSVGLYILGMIEYILYAVSFFSYRPDLDAAPKHKRQSATLLNKP